MPGLNYNIGGALPFPSGGNAAAGMAAVGGGLGIPGLGQVANQYGQSYQAALQQNQAQYGNILKGYQQLMGNQVANQAPIQQGYADLSKNVLAGIQGVGASQKQAIQDAYAQQSGGLQQSMVNSGLGNTTVTGSMQRGVQLDSQKAQVALANQIAQLNAGYQSNLGLAGLNYQNQANMQNTALGAKQLDWMNSVNFGYPNAQDYNSLFGQAGQFQQMGQNRALQQRLMGIGPNGMPQGMGQGGGSAGVMASSGNRMAANSQFGAYDTSGWQTAGGRSPVYPPAPQRPGGPAGMGGGQVPDLNMGVGDYGGATIDMGGAYPPWMQGDAGAGAQVADWSGGGDAAVQGADQGTGEGGQAPTDWATTDWNTVADGGGGGDFSSYGGDF